MRTRCTGDFYEPTVLADVDHSMLCMTEETFGPTLPVMKVADTEEAVRLANDSPYGLGGAGVRPAGQRPPLRPGRGCFPQDRPPRRGGRPAHRGRRRLRERRGRQLRGA